jgi:hypothetical protein
MSPAALITTVVSFCNRDIIPEQVEEIIATCKIQFFLGDMTQPNLGLSPENISAL